MKKLTESQKSRNDSFILLIILLMSLDPRLLVLLAILMENIHLLKIDLIIVNVNNVIRFM